MKPKGGAMRFAPPPAIRQPLINQPPPLMSINTQPSPVSSYPYFNNEMKYLIANSWFNTFILK